MFPAEMPVPGIFATSMSSVRAVPALRGREDARLFVNGSRMFVSEFAAESLSTGSVSINAIASAPASAAASTNVCASPSEPSCVCTTSATR